MPLKVVDVVEQRLRIVAEVEAWRRLGTGSTKGGVMPQRLVGIWLLGAGFERWRERRFETASVAGRAS
jgi:hypothetical protein